MSTEDIADGMHSNTLIRFKGPGGVVKTVMLTSKQGKLAVVDIYLHRSPDVVLSPILATPTVMIASVEHPEWKHIYLDELDGWCILNAWIESFGLVRVLLEHP